MPTYSSIIKAICPHSGKLLQYCGDNIEAISFAHAREILDNSGRGFMTVDAVLISEIDYKTNKNINYENLN
jgi:hypothetical protein